MKYSDEDCTTPLIEYLLTLAFVAIGGIFGVPMLSAAISHAMHLASLVLGNR